MSNTRPIIGSKFKPTRYETRTPTTYEAYNMTNKEDAWAQKLLIGKPTLKNWVIALVPAAIAIAGSIALIVWR